MKVIRNTILNKIDAEVDRDPDNIVRIELNNEEFIEMLQSIDNSKISNYSLMIDGHLLSIVGDFYIAKDLYSKSNHSGSYIVYRGICIQTHQRYE